MRVIGTESVKIVISVQKLKYIGLIFVCASLLWFFMLYLYTLFFY